MKEIAIHTPKEFIKMNAGLFDAKEQIENG
jgi:hypothetical protein